MSADSRRRLRPGTLDARSGTRPGVRKTKRELLQTRCRPELLLLRPPDPAVASGQLERARLPADQREPGLAVQRDMARALADDAVEPQAVMLLDQAVPEPVLTPATGRAHRDRAQVDGRIRRRKNHHGQHAATSRTISWLVSAETTSPKSPRAGHRADNEVALRKSHAEKAGHSQKNSPWFAHRSPAHIDILHARVAEQFLETLLLAQAALLPAPIGCAEIATN